MNVCPSDARTRYNGVSVVAVSGFFQRIDEDPFVFLFLFGRPVLVTVPIAVVGGIGLLFFFRQHFQTHGPTRFVVLVGVEQRRLSGWTILNVWWIISNVYTVHLFFRRPGNEKSKGRFVDVARTSLASSSVAPSRQHVISRERHALNLL